MILREELETIESNTLKPYACLSAGSSRKNPISSHPIRTEFQRDRDRILHSKAFRRLEYKTQVFLTQRSDHLRTRLTHSLEVSQLSGTIAQQLGLNTTLTEAIALGHDLGHAPFGHAGEQRIQQILENEAITTFKHNCQSVRIVDILEKKYRYDGLNLTLPVREGILKHTKLPKAIPIYCSDLFTDFPDSATLEGQVVAIADEIAQMTHDMDDYLRYNVIGYNKLIKHEIFNAIQEFYLSEHGWDFWDYINSYNNLSNKKESIVRCLVDFLVTKLIQQSDESLRKAAGLKPFALTDCYIKYDDEFYSLILSFDKYLKSMLYKDYRIQEMDRRGADVVESLFTYYRKNPKKMPSETRKKYRSYADGNNVIVIADFIAGMTDRYALEMYELVLY